MTHGALPVWCRELPFVGPIIPRAEESVDSPPAARYLTGLCAMLPCAQRGNETGGLMSIDVLDAGAPGGAQSAAKSAQAERVRRHLAVVRIMHWIMAAGVLGLIVSGTGILISHPRLYWGETGGIGAPSLV